MKIGTFFSVSILALLMAAFTPAQADPLLDGQTVQVQYLFPDIDTVFLANSTNVVVGPGVEVTDFPVGDPHTNIDLSDTNIYITYNSAGAWSDTSFNGEHFFDVNGTIPDFTNVTINTATNLPGFNASRITFDANNVWINWQELSFDSGTIVSLDFNEGIPAIPEPTSLLLLGTGLGTLALAAWRRRK